MTNSGRVLTQSDLEDIERIIYKSADDVAASISRSFERLEDRLDAAESRIYSRLAELDERAEASRRDIADRIDELTDKLRQPESTSEEGALD